MRQTMVSGVEDDGDGRDVDERETNEVCLQFFGCPVLARFF